MSAHSLISENSLSLFLDQLARTYHARPAPMTTGRIEQDAWSDEALVDAIVNRGSQQHFRALMARYKSRVHQLCLSVLGPPQQAQRMMVCQHYWLDMQTREIAESLACPEGTVKVYLSRARLQLAELLGDLNHE